MKKNKQQIIKYIAYLYLILGYSSIIFFLSYCLQTGTKPIGWLLIITMGLIYFIAYSAINHLLISKVLSNRLLIIIEVLLIASMLALIISDGIYENAPHL